MDFVPAAFTPPEPLRTSQFRLELLGPQHAASDYAAWTSSIAFIHGLPGWSESTWPTPMSFDANLRDCEEHLERSRAGGVEVMSWVTEQYAELDKPLHDAVRRWLDKQWPWTEVHYASR